MFTTTTCRPATMPDAAATSDGRASAVPSPWACIPDPAIGREPFHARVRDDVRSMPSGRHRWSALPGGVCEEITPGWSVFAGIGDARGFRWLQAIHPEDRQKWLDAWSTQRGTAFEMNCRLRDRDGCFHPFRAEARSIVDADGHIVRWVGSFIPLDATNNRTTGTNGSASSPLPPRGAGRSTTEPDRIRRPREPRREAVAGNGSESWTILVVEDHGDTADVMRLVLEGRGWNVLIASTMAQAIETTERNHVDLLVCDIGLPDGNGLDLLARIRRQRPMLAIAVSGYGTDIDRRRSLDAGFAAHLTKPFGINELVEVIERTLA